MIGRNGKEPRAARVLAEMSRAEVAEAIAENAVEWLLAMGRAGGGEERREPHIHWIIGGSPQEPTATSEPAPVRCPIAYHNAVVRADLTPQQADEEIERFQRRLREDAVPGSWHVGPSMRPEDVRARLVAHGFSGSPNAGTGEPGMAADLLALPDLVPVPAGVTIEQVRDQTALDAWRETLADGFGEGEIEAEWVAEMYRRIGLSEDLPWRHYLGRWDDQPAATASIFLGAGVCGLYFVNVRPAFRRRGIGTAITVAALQAGHGLGFCTGVLGASAMGYRVYQRLGFREYTRIGVCEWSPA